MRYQPHQQQQQQPARPIDFTSNDIHATMVGIQKRREQKEEEDIRLNGPKKRYNSMGHEIDGKFTKDRAVLRWGTIVGLWLFFSWIGQWAMFALPYWRADQYHTAGLFQVCGTADFQFNPKYSDTAGAGNLTIKSKHPHSCQSVEEYTASFLEMVAPDPKNPQPSDRWYANAKDALPHIQASRWLEAIGTLFDMCFGVGTLLLIMRPAADERVEARNAAITVAGIVIMPWFPVFDILISFSYWDQLGVGYFQSLQYESSSSLSNYTIMGPIVSLFTSWSDFVVQLWFLGWGLKRVLGANKKTLRSLFTKDGGAKREEEHVMTLFPKAKAIG
ncbi:hypothetical protein BDR26DRAFT_862632, partial [Obelidium mucronatum]